MKHLGILLALPLAAACTQVNRNPAPTEPAARVVGKADSCIQLRTVSRTLVRDDRTIDFEAGANRVYRNTLPNPCPGLGSERVFTYSTSTSQLCRSDLIYVREMIGTEPQRGAGCPLGDFVPVEYIR
jgi:hypothetical protein